MSLEKFPIQNGHVDENPWVIGLAEEVSGRVKVSKGSFTERAGHQESDVKSWIERVWSCEAQKNPKIFNGDQTTIYSRPDDNGHLKVLHNDFATVCASRDANKKPELHLRDHFNPGVIILCRTSDGKILVSKNRADEGDVLQFPGGFIGGEKYKKTENIIADLRKNPECLINIINETSLREGAEEILKSFKDSHPKQEYLGYIGKKFNWPSKTNESGTKKVVSIKSFVVLAETALSSKELTGQRDSDLPEDAGELPKVKFLDEKEALMAISSHKPVNVEGKEIPFIVEHREALSILQRAKEKQRQPQRF